MQNNTTETKKLEVVGMLRFETDLSEFCKSDGFTALSGEDLKRLVAKLGKNGETVSETLKDEIIGALSFGNGYTEFLQGDNFAEAEDLTPEADFIVNLLEETENYETSISIKKNDGDWLNYEFKFSTDIKYIPYDEFVRNLTIDDIDLSDKLDNLNDGGDIEGYKETSTLYKMYQKACDTGIGNEIFDEEGSFRDDIVPQIEDSVHKYIKNTLVKDIKQGNREWESDIMSEMLKILFEWDCLDTQDEALTGALYNMDTLYLDALDSVAKGLKKSKKAKKAKKEAVA